MNGLKITEDYPQVSYTDKLNRHTRDRMSNKLDKKSKEYWTRGPGRAELAAKQAAAATPQPTPEEVSTEEE